MSGEMDNHSQQPDNHSQQMAIEPKKEPGEETGEGNHASAREAVSQNETKDAGDGAGKEGCKGCRGSGGVTIAVGMSAANVACPKCRPAEYSQWKQKERNKPRKVDNYTGYASTGSSN